MLLPCWWSVLQLHDSVLAYNLLDFFDKLDGILFSLVPEKESSLLQEFSLIEDKYLFRFDFVLWLIYDLTSRLNIITWYYWQLLSRRVVLGP